MKNKYILFALILIQFSFIGTVLGAENVTTLEVLVKDTNDVNYDNMVNYSIYTDKSLSGGSIQPVDGKIAILLSDFQKGETFTYLVISPSNDSAANSVKVDLTDKNLNAVNDLGTMTFQVATLTGQVTNGTAAVANVEVIATFGGDMLLVSTDSNGEFSIAPLTNDYTGNVSLMANDWNNGTMSEQLDVPINSTNVELICNISQIGQIGQYGLSVPYTENTGTINIDELSIYEDNTEYIITLEYSNASIESIETTLAYTTGSAIVLVDNINTPEKINTLNGVVQYHVNTADLIENKDITITLEDSSSDDNIEIYFSLNSISLNDIPSTNELGLGYDIGIPVATAKIYDENGALFTGYVEYNIYTDNGTSGGNTYAENGIIEVYLYDKSKGSSYTYLVIAPSDGSAANSVKMNLADKNLNTAIDLGTMSFQVATLTGKVTYDGTEAATNVEVNAMFDEDQLLVWTDSNGEFSVAPLTNDYNGNVSLKAYDWNNNLMSNELVVNYDATNISLVCDLDSTNSGGDTGSENSGGDTGSVNTLGIDSFEITLTDENDKRIRGTKVFETEETIVVYAPENTVGTFKMIAYDSENNVIDLSEEVIAIDISGFGVNPEYNPVNKKIEVFNVSGGYGDTFFGKLNIGTYYKEIVIKTYKGKLGLINVVTPNDSLVDNWVSYAISYKIDGSGSGSNSNGRAYNGELAIPIQNDFVNVDYAYTVISSEVAVNGENFANTEFIDLTDIMSDNSTEFYDLGTAKLQVPTMTVSVLDKEGNVWDDAHTSIYTSYVGEDYDFDGVYFDMQVIEGKNYLASLGANFSSKMNLTIQAWGDTDNYPIDKIVDLTGSSAITLQSPDLKANFEGNLLMPNGSDLVPVGHGRDTSVYFRDLSGNSFHPGINGDSGEYSIVNLIEGREYEIFAYFDLGDFNDVGITDSIPIRMVYDKTPGTFTTKDIEGNSINYIVNVDGTVELDLIATYPILIGHVNTGDLPATNGISVSVYDLDGKKVSEGRIHTVTIPDSDDTDQAVYMIGGVNDIVGSYTIVVDDPVDTVDYTGFSFIHEFTSDTLDELDIQLPESIINGKLIVSESDESKYANNFRRVYINVFDEYGNYVTNGKVRSDGVFAVGQLENGRYYAEAFVSPYSSLAVDYISSGREVFIVDNTQKTTFDLPLKKIIASGTVLNPSEEQVSDVWVTILDSNYEEVVSVSSDLDGNFSIPELEDGTYLIKALGDNGLTDSFEKELVVTGSVIDVSDIRLNLTNPLLVGSVFANESTVENIDVLIFNSDMQFVTFESVDSDGYFAFGGLNDGTYYLQAIPKVNIEGYTQTDLIEVTVNSNESVTFNINLYVVEIRGAVFDPSGNEINGGWVHLYNGEHLVSTAKVSDSGSFEFGNLEDGTVYTVMADASNTSFNPSLSLEVTKGDLEAELTLREDASIVGVIEDSEGYIANQAIYLYDLSKAAVAVTYTNVFGEFSFIDLEVGKYTFVTLTTNGEPVVVEVDYLGQEIIAETIILN